MEATIEKYHFEKHILWTRDLLLQPTKTVLITLVGDLPGINSVNFGFRKEDV